MRPECPLEDCGEQFDSHRARAQHLRRDHDISRPPVDRARLQELYVGEDHTQAEIADHYDVAQGTIGNWLREYGITKATRLPADD